MATVTVVTDAKKPESPLSCEVGGAPQLPTPTSSGLVGKGKGKGWRAPPPPPPPVQVKAKRSWRSEQEKRSIVEQAAAPPEEVTPTSLLDCDNCVSLGFEEGFISSLDSRGEKHVRSLLFGQSNEIIELLRSQAPTLELEVDFKAGRVVPQGTNIDLAWALPQVCALVQRLQPELRHKLVQIRGRMAAETRAEEFMQQRVEEVRQNPPVLAVLAPSEPQPSHAAAFQDEDVQTREAVRNLEKHFKVRLEDLPPAPVPQTLLQLECSHFQCTEGLVQVLPSRCWVVPGVLTGRECEEWIQRAQAHGMEPSRINAARHNSRTKNFIDLDRARLVWNRLPAALLGELQATAPKTAVRSVHEQWRISRYQPGQYFRAHYDESYTRGSEYGNENGVISNEHGEHGETSSHTLLLILSDNFSKGATRFWPTGKYDEAVDVRAPQGSMLVFEQQTLLHEGTSLEAGIKFVAQGALMRAPKRKLAPSTPTFSTGFRFGPGASSFANGERIN